MEDTKTPQQMAAVWDDLEGRCIDGTLKAIGEPGSWAVTLTYDVGSNHQTMFLASARRPTRMREFKTLDAALNAAIEVQRLRLKQRYPSDYARLAIATRIKPIEASEEWQWPGHKTAPGAANS